MDKLDTAKKVIKENIDDARYGIFNTRNILGDPMDNIHYDDSGLRIDICYEYSYFEVFGLTKEEFAELSEYYGELLLEEDEEDK